MIQQPIDELRIHKSIVNQQMNDELFMNYKMI